MPGDVGFSDNEVVSGIGCGQRRLTERVLSKPSWGTSLLD